MIYLDTHVVVWLYAGLVDLFSPEARGLINADDLLVSPIVNLELQYLFEIGRVKADGDTILGDLSARLGLGICARPFNAIVGKAVALSWTRDPFDRIIVAQAALGENLLISKDEKILANYTQARW